MRATTTSSPLKYDERYISWKSWDDGFATYSSADLRYFSGEVSRTGIHLSNEIHMLEIGFGSGAFLAWARDARHLCDGVEINPHLIGMALNAGFRVYEGMEKVPAQNKYDLIVAFDVLEHVPDNSLLEFLSSLTSLLSNGGVILLRFPNGDSPFGRLYQNGDITHRSAIGSNKIRQLAHLSELRVRYISSPHTPKFDNPASNVKKKAIQLLRNVFERLISKLYFDGQKIEFHPNLVVALIKGKSDAD
jgi:SAM-dependent methyltransferase